MVQVEPDQPLNILHLEDSLADHALAARILKKSGMACHIHRVDTLEAFVSALSAQQFDAVLADYRLPGFTAVDAWELLRDRPQSPPFILVSGAIGEAAAVDAMHLGVSDYLLKEDLVRLPHVLKRALEMHEARLAHKKAVADLAVSERRLAELTEHLQTSIEQERAAIAREIHDDIGGALTAVRFDIAWISRHTHDDAMQRHATAANEMLQHAIGASQRIMMNLRPPILEQGLVAAVRWLASNFEQRTHIPTQVLCHATEITCAPEIQLTAYRVVQEALTNISKHAQASSVLVDLSDSEKVLTVEITDNGQGMESADQYKPKSFGLRGLNERATTVGGWLDVSSRQGAGTSVILSVPLEPGSAHLSMEGTS